MVEEGRGVIEGEKEFCREISLMGRVGVLWVEEVGVDELLAEAKEGEDLSPSAEMGKWGGIKSSLEQSKAEGDANEEAANSSLGGGESFGEGVGEESPD